MERYGSDADEQETPLLRRQPEDKLEKAPACCSSRYGLALLSSFGYFVAYSLRVNLSVTMVDMVNSTQISSNQSGSSVCPPHGNAAEVSPYHSAKTYAWDSETQGWILGSFFYGYILTQLPGGYLAIRYGPKWPMGFGLLTTVLFTLLTPLAAELGAGYLIAVRVLEGVGEGVTFPSMFTMWAAWAPPLERTRLLTINQIGVQMGTIISLPLSAEICFYLGWPNVFYIFGCIGLVWFVLWAALVHNSPNSHPRISERERIYINNSLKSELATSSGDIPWKSILTSGPLWAIAAAHFAFNWTFYTLLTLLPTYMSNVLGFSIQQNGIVSALPYIGSALSALLCSQIADYLRETCLVRTVVVRKAFSLVAMVGTAVFLVAAGHTGCDYVLATALIVVSSTLGGAATSGFNINHLDIAPSYAGILLGITNTFATIPGMVGPVVAGAITPDNTMQEWQVVFYIAAGINIAGAIIYTLFGKGDVQPWAVQSPYTHGD